MSEDHTGPLSRSQTLAVAIRTANTGANGHGIAEDVAHTLDQAQGQAVAQPVPYDLYQVTAPVNRQNRAPGDPCHTLARDNAAHAAIVQQPVAIAFSAKDSGMDAAVELSPTLRAQNSVDGNQNSSWSVAVAQQPMQVRRLTPVECERLQGFPDGYTAIPWRKKPASDCPDGPRYKALGNSWAVPVVRWIGERIERTVRNELLR